jgi:hypothetical protein
VFNALGRNLVRRYVHPWLLKRAGRHPPPDAAAAAAATAASPTAAAAAAPAGKAGGQGSAVAGSGGGAAGSTGGAAAVAVSAADVEAGWTPNGSAVAGLDFSQRQMQKQQPQGAAAGVARSSAGAAAAAPWQAQGGRQQDLQGDVLASAGSSTGAFLRSVERSVLQQQQNGMQVGGWCRVCVGYGVVLGWAFFWVPANCILHPPSPPAPPLPCSWRPAEAHPVASPPPFCRQPAGSWAV